jgi:hypothetical protein
MARPDIVPVDGDGKIMWYGDEAWRSLPVVASDRVVLEKDMLGSPVSRPFLFPGCGPSRGLYVSTPQGVAWLVTCSDSVLKTTDVITRRVAFDEANGEIASRFYNYKFNLDNQMLFKTVTLKGSPDVVLSSDSNLYIKADIKNFFTLNFLSSDVESKMMTKRIEPTTALASLGFYLKVLFFKIVLDLRTDVAFFESSANIPMVMTLPVDASKRLHRKSGILYSFVLGETIQPNLMDIGMPMLNPGLLSGDFKPLGLKQCDVECTYQLTIPAGGKKAKMRIVIPKALVERGMFPWFVGDLAAVQEEMDWALPKKMDLKKRIGIYFEVSGLPAGSHPWDFWMSF